MKRANGTGNIVKMEGQRRRPYAVRVSYQARPGLYRQKYLSYHRTAREAQAALDAYLARHLPPQSVAVTWGEVYAQWATRKFERAGPKSVASYKASWSRLSVLADKEMCRITIDDLQGIIDRDERAGLSRSSINNDKGLMKALFRHAMERDVIAKDYSEFVQLPTVAPKAEKGAFTERQMEQLRGMAETGTPWADTVLMLCYTGFRISEFLALTPASYHLDGNYLQGGMKTAAGKNRIVPVHPAIQPYLERRLLQKGERIITGPTGRPVSDNWYRTQAFPPIAAALGTPQATPHWCRHTAASRMKLAGVDDLAARRILGHANKDITEHYTHTDLEFLAREIRKLD